MVIYVLELNDGKCYVGKTDNLEQRLRYHKADTNTTSWTNLHRFKSLLRTYDESETEDFYTIKYMAEYGIDNVRGGSFCAINLSESDKTVINKMISTQLGLCFKCSKSGHYVSECPNKGQTYLPPDPRYSDILYEPEKTEYFVYREIRSLKYAEVIFNKFSSNSFGSCTIRIYNHNLPPGMFTRKKDCYSLLACFVPNPISISTPGPRSGGSPIKTDADKIGKGVLHFMKGVCPEVSFKRVLPCISITSEEDRHMCYLNSMFSNMDQCILELRFCGMIFTVRLIE